MRDLSSFSTHELAEELLLRSGEILDEHGAIQIKAVYDFVATVQPIASVDGIPVRRNERDELEVMAIVRNTGPYSGKLCSVGGRIGTGETIRDALERHFDVDLGCSIEILIDTEFPMRIGQWGPFKEHATRFAGFRPGERYGLSNYYPVILKNEPSRFGTTAHGGQEARGVQWFSRRTMPSLNHFGYEQGMFFATALNVAEKLI